MLGTIDKELGTLGNGPIDREAGYDKAATQPFVVLLSLTGYRKNADYYRHQTTLVVQSSPASVCKSGSNCRLKFASLLMFGKLSNATTVAFML
jgi:hypothetical protein